MIWVRSSRRESGRWGGGCVVSRVVTRSRALWRSACEAGVSRWVESWNVPRIGISDMLGRGSGQLSESGQFLTIGTET